jgi:hypothetical protein
MLENIPDDPMSNEDDFFKIPLMLLLTRKLMIPQLIITAQHWMTLVIPLVLPSSSFSPIDRSANYLRHHANNKNGPLYVVSKSIFGSIQETGTINYQQVFYHILITLFLLTITTNQQDMFASIMEFSLVLNEKYSQQRLLNTTVPLYQNSPPSSMQDFWNRYLRDPQSIVSNLDFPEIHFRHGHAYVSVRDCIENLLAHWQEVNALYSGMKLKSEVVGADVMVKSTAECLKMRQMMIRDQAKYPKDNILCLPLYGRGDDDDPSVSIKGGRASCHCKSVAISPLHGKHNSLDNKCIIALIWKTKESWRHGGWVHKINIVIARSTDRQLVLLEINWKRR